MAARALGRFGAVGKQAVPQLLVLRSDANEEVQDAGDAAIVQIKTNGVDFGWVKPHVQGLFFSLPLLGAPRLRLS